MAQPLRSPQPSRSSDRRLAIARSPQSPPRQFSDVEAALSECPDSIASDERLDESSLNTVLDMLAAMQTADELDILESLTEAQKRQIWDATPRALKIQLWHLRQAAAVAPSPSTDLATVATCEPLSQTAIQSTTPVPTQPATSADSDSGLDGSETALNILDTPSEKRETTIEVGDRVVLKAEPDRTVAELKAIFEVTHIQAQTVQVQAELLGMREYPLDWLLIYAKQNRPELPQ